MNVFTSRGYGPVSLITGDVKESSKTKFTLTATTPSVTACSGNQCTELSSVYSIIKKNGIGESAYQQKFSEYDMGLPLNNPSEPCYKNTLVGTRRNTETWRQP